MADDEVDVSAELAKLAEAKANAEGQRLPDLIEQWMREYLEGKR